jgi:Arc/MetJ-type ribon-helix-helix transcriptional regulator
MNWLLPSDIQDRVDAQLALGTFGSAEDVLREAMDALERRQNGLDQLRQLVAIAEGDVSSGRVGSFDRDDIKSSVRRRLSDRGIGD